MKYLELKLILIKKVRDVYFLIKFGKGKFFINYIKTFFYHFFLKKNLYLISRIQNFLINGFIKINRI